MVPEAAFVGFTVPIDQVTLWLEALITIAVNCCCWPALKLIACWLTVTLFQPPSKNTPLTTALFPAVRVTLIFACPRSEERRVGKECKLGMLLVYKKAMVFASRI